MVVFEEGVQLLTMERLHTLKENTASKYIQTNRETPARVLEIGCGIGALAILLAQRGVSVTGIDYSPAMLAGAEEKIRGSGLLENADLFCVDATEYWNNWARAFIRSREHGFKGDSTV